MAIFTTRQVKVYSTKIFLYCARVGGLDEIFVQQKYSAIYIKCLIIAFFKYNVCTVYSCPKRLLWQSLEGN